MPVVKSKVVHPQETACQAKNVVCTGVTAENISRHELLSWVNETLGSNFQKIEEMRTGAAYCQLMHVLFPRSLIFKKVKFNANLEHEMRQNFMIFQTALEKVKIEKQIPIEKLIKGRFQDNFEFLQWFKKFYDVNHDEKEYDALAARGGIQLGAGNPKNNAPKPIRPLERKETFNQLKTSTPKEDEETGEGENVGANLEEVLKDLKEEKGRLEEQTGTIVSEKDYYLSKIQNLEKFCSLPEHCEVSIAKKIMEVLHKAQ